MNWMFWCITVVPVLLIVSAAVYSRRYVRDVVDYLAAGRVAGRYVLAVGDLEAALGVVTLIAMIEERYRCGFAMPFWSNLLIPIGIIASLTGYCTYRFRETRALSIGQFWEMRYSRSFRIFAASLRTLSEMLTNSIGPAVAARFFIYFLGLPHTVELFGMPGSTFGLVMVVFLLLAVTVIWPGGKISLIITDFFQGIISYPIFVVFTVFVLTKFSWSGEIAPVLMERAAGESFINPFDVSKLRDFNLFATIVFLLGRVINKGSWIGSDNTGAARTPHEQKMSGILGAWRNGFSQVMCTLLAVAVLTLMTHADFSREAHEIRRELSSHVAEEVIESPEELASVKRAVAEAAPYLRNPEVDPAPSQNDNADTRFLGEVKKGLDATGGNNETYRRFRTLYYQMMPSIAMRAIFPPLLGAVFCLLMVMLMLSTDDYRIYNSSVTIIQDIVMPLRGKPFSPRIHLLMLRLSAVAVAAFFFLASFFMAQLDYINMFITITTAIWLGGSGPVMIFGLYSRFGTTAGAWTSLICGSGFSIGGILLQRNWAGAVYPWLLEHGCVAALDHFLRGISAPFYPYIAWRMDPVNFPLNSRELYFLAILCGLLGYIVASLITYREPFNLERMLHRGQYAVAGEHKQLKSPWSWSNLYAKLITITPEYTLGDKVIAWSVFFYSIVFQLLIAFVGVTVWQMFWPLSDEWWSKYFLWVNLIIASIAGVISTVWFMAGGIVDAGRLFRDLKNRRGNSLDNGWVEGHVPIVDKNMDDAAKKQTEE